MDKQYLTKQSIRASAYNTLAEMSAKERAKKSKIICERLFTVNDYQLAKSVFVYLSAFSEVETDCIVKHALDNKKIVYVPVTNEKMVAVRINKDTKFISGKYGIRQPEYFTLESQPKIDLALIPLVAFDNHKNRLGRGGGYYDYYLKDFTGKKIALAYEEQCFDSVAAVAHDVAMDKIVTDRRVLD